MSAHPIYRPQSPLMQWLEQRLPIGSTLGAAPLSAAS